MRGERLLREAISASRPRLLNPGNAADNKAALTSPVAPGPVETSRSPARGEAREGSSSRPREDGPDEGWWDDRIEDDERDLAWAAVMKRTFEAFVRGERPNMYGEWFK